MANALTKGDHAPWFHAPALSGAARYAFDTVAGRHVLLLFFHSARIDASAEALAVVRRHRALFDDERACFFGVTSDPSDAAEGRIGQELPGIRFFLDYDRAVASLYGAASGEKYRLCWMLLDPALRVVEILPVDQGEKAVTMLRSALGSHDIGGSAPVLVVPDVLDTELCRTLIAAYEAGEKRESGSMRDVAGQTVEISDPFHKMRRDHGIEDESLKRSIRTQMNRRLSPALDRAFRFKPTRMERYIVACYEAGAGHFRAHRDNTTLGTAHRQFAVTINLNTGDYDGGDLRFPEYGQRTYRAPRGGAVVFSCSLLHEATPVTAGRRFAFLPFLYDEEGAKIREENSHFLAEGGGMYRRDQKR